MIFIKKITTLSGRGQDIYYKFTYNEIEIKWGETDFLIDRELLGRIIKEFFVNKEKWYTLGASMTDPVKGGLGEYLSAESSLTPRHASAIAAIMYNENLIDYKMRKRIDLKRIV